jgi:hypothetical protein
MAKQILPVADSVAARKSLKGKWLNMKALSKSGCFIRLQEKPTVGSRLEMEITLPPEILGYAAGPFHCQGEVVRVENPEKKGKKSRVVCTIDNYRLNAPVKEIESEEACLETRAS